MSFITIFVTCSRRTILKLEYSNKISLSAWIYRTIQVQMLGHQCWQLCDVSAYFVLVIMLVCLAFVYMVMS